MYIADSEAYPPFEKSSGRRRSAHEQPLQIHIKGLGLARDYSNSGQLEQDLQ